MSDVSAGLREPQEAQLRRSDLLAPGPRRLTPPFYARRRNGRNTDAVAGRPLLGASPGSFGYSAPWDSRNPARQITEESNRTENRGLAVRNSAM